MVHVNSRYPWKPWQKVFLYRNYLTVITMMSSDMYAFGLTCDDLMVHQATFSDIKVN